MSDAPSNSDPKFTPAASSLGKIGMKVGDIKTDDALIAFVARGQQSRQMSEAQEAVAVYVARKRGHDFTWIATNLGLKKETAGRREIEGMAILRLHIDEANILRTVNAIRVGELGIKVVDEITSRPCTLDDDEIDERMYALEDMAAAGQIRKKYTSSEGSDQKLTEKKAAEVLAAAKAVVTRQVQPMNTSNLISAAAYTAEDAGISVRVAKRTPTPPVKAGPQLLEVTIKQALDDVLRMEKDAKEPYDITKEDYAVLTLLLAHFDLTLEANDALMQIEARFEQVSK